MNRKGIFVEFPSLYIIVAGLVFFTLMFSLAGFVFSPAKGSIKDVDSVAGGARVNDFLLLNTTFDGKATTTLELLDTYCFNDDEVSRKNQSQEIKKRARAMFDNLFVSAQFECSSYDKINLRDYICEDPKLYPIVSKDDSFHRLYYCDEPKRVVTYDGLEWERHGIYGDRLDRATKDVPQTGTRPLPDMTDRKSVV